jgi:hypothetical protein
MHLEQFPFGQVSEWFSAGMIVPFLGAGASRVGVPPEAQLPDGAGLARELVDRMGKAFPGDSSQELPKVAQFYEHLVFDRDALYGYLHDRFQTRAQAPLSRAAMLLASMPGTGKPLFMITTNYDTLVERAFADAGRPLCVITQDMRDPEYGASRLSVSKPDGGILQSDGKIFQLEDAGYPADAGFLFKMHGSVRAKALGERDDLIITEDDYVDFLVNSGGSLSPFFPPAALLRAYKARRFLFLGYSLQDWNFRAFLRLLARRNAITGGEQRRHWAIQRNPHPLDGELWRQRHVNVYDGDLLDFCDALEAEWAREAR